MKGKFISFTIYAIFGKENDEKPSEKTRGVLKRYFSFNEVEDVIIRHTRLVFLFVYNSLNDTVLFSQVIKDVQGIRFIFGKSFKIICCYTLLIINFHSNKSAKFQHINDAINLIRALGF